MKYRLSLRESWDGEPFDRPLYTNVAPMPGMFIVRAGWVYRVEGVMIHPAVDDGDEPEDVTVLVEYRSRNDERHPG